MTAASPPDTQPLRAEPLLNPTPAVIHQIVEHCNEHRPWFGDFAWEHPERRTLTIKHISDIYYEAAQGNAFLWGVWRGAALCGIINIGQIVPHTDATCHFIFFDHRLADKKDLCIETMRWCFDKLQLHRLSVEIPTYARALAKFARKLGFRYEAEAREPYQHKDEKLEPLGLAKAYVGSRRYRATLYNKEWHDLLLLSILREEFDSIYGRTSQDRREGHRELLQDPGTQAPRRGTDSPNTGAARPE